MLSYECVCVPTALINAVYVCVITDVLQFYNLMKLWETALSSQPAELEKHESVCVLCMCFVFCVCVCACMCFVC